MPNPPPSEDTERRIVPLRKRGRAATGSPQPRDLGRYQQIDEPDDYRHRMFANAAGFAVVLLLIAAGLWIADTMASMRKNQDCVLSGRRGCTPVETPAQQRW
jgi:hypothetical protein